MRKPFALQVFVLFLLAIPIINAASISIFAPDYIIEGESVNVNFSINSASSLGGTVYLSYTNINSSISSAGFTDASFTGEYYNYSWSIKGNLPGAYSIFANLTNSSGITLAALNKTGTVNSSMPTIISALPSGIVSKDNTILMVRTNEIATCRYGATNNTYENLPYIFSNTGSTSHNQSINGLSEGEHTYYVRCQDSNGYAMNQSAMMKFTIDLAPSAQITLSDSSPVKAGTIEVALLISENLENAPTLEYSFNDAPSTRKQISLSGSSSVWKGYLIVTEIDDKKIGTFYFTAADGVGNVGTKIMSGNVFVVDAAKPPAPQSVKAAAEPDGSIKLSWYYDGEETDYFSIYRATSSGINYVDYYAKSNGSTQFIDRSAIDKATYYYKISAVDKASNEGPLSEEVFATSVNKAITASRNAAAQEIDVPKVLPPGLVSMVDTYAKKIDKLLIDVKDISSQLEEKQGEKKELIKELKLIEQAASAKSKLESLKEQLEDFKAAYATEQELEQKLNAVDLEAKKIEKTTPKNADILEKSEFLQSTGREDIENATNRLFKDISFTQEEKNAYIKKNEKEKDKIKVAVDVKVVSIAFLDGTKSEKSIIRKKLTYQNPETLNDVIVIEAIPKTIAENVNEIEFSRKYEVLNEDPIVKFGFLKFNFEGEEIAYTLSKKINVEEAKNAKSIVLLSLNELTKSPNKVIGYSILDFTGLGLSKAQEIFVWIGVLAIIALSAYYLLFVKNYGYMFKKLGRTLKMKRMKSQLNEQVLPDLPELPSKSLLFSNDSARSFDQDANKMLNEMYLHIKNAKADLADNLLPLFVTLNSKLESKGFGKRKTSNGNNGIVFINTLIDQAHGYLDEDLHSEAVKLYPKINFIYQNLPEETKAEVYGKCAQLHRRMNSAK